MHKVWGQRAICLYYTQLNRAKRKNRAWVGILHGTVFLHGLQLSILLVYLASVMLNFNTLGHVWIHVTPTYIIPLFINHIGNSLCSRNMPYGRLTRLCLYSGMNFYDWDQGNFQGAWTGWILTKETHTVPSQLFARNFLLPRRETHIFFLYWHIWYYFIKGTSLSLFYFFIRSLSFLKH